MSGVLWKFSFREVLSRRGRAVLTLLSIVIGVAAVVSVTMAISTTRRAYQEMFASVTGRAALEVVAEGGGSYDEGNVALVEQTPGVQVAAPIVQRRTILFAGGQRVKLVALGIDPQKDTAVRDYRLAEGRFLQQGKDVLLDAEFARGMGIKLNDPVHLLTRRGVREATAVGLLSSQGTAALQLGGLVFMPLQRAQALFTGKGQVDKVQVVLQDGADDRAVQAQLAGKLPVGISVRRPIARTELVEETLLSSEQALQLTSAFSLLLAAFIIFNTFLMNVGERRRQLAIMRAIGATRRQILGLLYGESLVMGAIGTVLGIGAGLLGAYLLTGALDRILMTCLPPMEITATPFILAAICGLGISWLGVAYPAYRAGRLSPLEGLTGIVRGDVEGTSHKSTILGTIVGLASGSVLAGCILGWLPIDLAVTSAVFLLIGIVLWIPAILGRLSRIVTWVLSPLFQVEAHLAQRQILRHRARSTLTIAVLFVASATGIGMANSILDNIRDVRIWYRHTIVGDFFVRAMMPDMATGMSADIPEAFGEKIRQIPGITGLDTARFVEARAEDQSVVVIAREFSSDELTYFDLKGGDPKRLRSQLHEGQVVLGTVLAQRTGLGVGDEITLETLQGPQRLRIAGLTNEYLVGGLAIYMQRDFARQLLDVKGVDAYIIKAAPHRVNEVQTQLQALCDQYGVLLHSFVDISRMIDGMIVGIDGCLWGILVLGFVVAAFGVVNTLTMNVLEQTRELGLLRVVAMTRRQVRKTIFTQAAIIGTLGLVPGTVAGFGVAYLINLATMPVIGHPVAFGFYPGLLFGGLFGALTIVIAAAWVPAERAARLDLVRALQYE